MKFNDTINDKNEMDDLNIDRHLNTSLDLSGISVSEDLINRTLAAIKEQPTQEQKSQTGSKEISKKIIPWNRYVRGFAGVAAAALIVVVGYNALSQIPFGGMSKNSTTSDSGEQYSADIAMEEAKEESVNFASNDEATATTEDNNTNAASITGVEEPETATQYTIAAATLAKDDAAGAAVEESKEGTVITEEEATATTDVTDTAMDIEVNDGLQARISTSLKISEAALFTFRDIFLPAPEEAEYITITDEINHTSISLTEHTDILDFYSVMDNHQFTYSTENSTEQNYTVEGKSPTQEALYTLIVGENITVRYAEGDLVNESTYYAVDDVLFKQALNDFYQKYNK